MEKPVVDGGGIASGSMGQSILAALGRTGPSILAGGISGGDTGR